MIPWTSNEEQLDFSDVLIATNISQINSRKDVKLKKEFGFTGKDGVSHSFDFVPIVSANMGPCGSISFARELVVKHEYCAALEKHIPAKDIIAFYKELEDLAVSEGKDPVAYRGRVFVSIGIREDLKPLKEINEKYPLVIINFDVPNGTIPAAFERLKELRASFPQAFIIAKTVCTAEQGIELVKAGANCIGVSVGCGAVCLTRQKAGVGRPIFSALADVGEMVHQAGGFILCDGGITCAGDLCKAFAIGADFVMVGSLFAATEESNDGEVIYGSDGKKYKQQYGMSSFYAQKKLFGATKDEMSHRTSEGRTKIIPCSGPVADLVSDFNGGLRSCGTYIGAASIDEFPSRASFYRVRRQLNETFANCKDF